MSYVTCSENLDDFLDRYFFVKETEHPVNTALAIDNTLPSVPAAAIVADVKGEVISLHQPMRHGGTSESFMVGLPDLPAFAEAQCGETPSKAVLPVEAGSYFSEVMIAELQTAAIFEL
jgi:hypothetical protein